MINKINYTRLSDKLFSVLYRDREYIYAYKHNLMRTLQDGITEDELNLPVHPRKSIPAEKEWGLDTPYFTIGITSTCNLHCSYCHVSGGDYTDTLSEEMIGSIKKLIAKSLAKHPEALKISFHSDGESLTKQSIMESIMDFTIAIKGNTRVYFSLSSNGTLINESNIDFIRRLTSVQISMDGIPELNDLNRGSSKLTINGIKTLMKAKTFFAIRSTLTPKTLDTLPQFIDFLAELVNPHSEDRLSVDVGLVYEGERSISNEMFITPDQFLDTYLEAKEYAKTKNIELSTPLEIVSYPGNSFCSAVEGCFFTPSGLLSSCTRVTRSDNSYANRFIYGKFNHSTLSYDIDQDIYNKLQTLRQTPKECEECPALMLCGGATCYLEKSETHCAIRSRLLLIERLKLGRFIEEENK